MYMRVPEYCVEAVNDTALESSDTSARLVAFAACVEPTFMRRGGDVPAERRGQELHRVRGEAAPATGKALEQGPTREAGGAMRAAP